MSNVFYHQGFFQKVPKYFWAEMKIFNLYDLPDITRQHKNSQTGYIFLGMLENISQKFSRLPKLYLQFEKKKFLSFPKLPKLFLQFGKPPNVKVEPKVKLTPSYYFICPSPLREQHMGQFICYHFSPQIKRGLNGIKVSLLSSNPWFELRLKDQASLDV